MQELQPIKWITASQLHQLLGGWQHPPFFEAIIKGVETQKKKGKGRPFIMYDLDQVIRNHRSLCEAKYKTKHEAFRYKAEHEKFSAKLKNLN